MNPPSALFVPNSLLNAFRRENGRDAGCTHVWQTIRAAAVKQFPCLPPVYPDTHLSFLANVYNHKARAFYHRYGVQLIDAAYEAHEEKPAMCR